MPPRAERMTPTLPTSPSDNPTRILTGGVSSIPSGSSAYNADDQLSTETYDVNGNTVTTAGKVFGYDSEDRLKSMNGSTVTMVYDGDGNRVAKIAGGVTTRYLVDDLNPTGYAQIVEEAVNGAVQREYTYGLQRICRAALKSQNGLQDDEMLQLNPGFGKGTMHFNPGLRER